MRLPVVNERGECLRRVVEGPQAVEALAGTGTTIDFALVLVRQGARVLLVRNRRRSLWELPGGLLAPGESPERAAARELAEETGQTAPRLDLLALVDLTLVGNAFTHAPAARRGVLYGARIARPTPFAASAEIEAMGCWPAHALPADTSAIDAALLLHFAGATSTGHPITSSP